MKQMNFNKMLKKVAFFLMIFLMSFETNAQDIQAKIIYNRKTDWISIMSKLPYMTQEEIDRSKLTWGNYSDNKGRNYELYIDNNKSLYLLKEEKSESGYSWKPEKFVLDRDHKKNTTSDVIETLGKTFLVEDAIPKYRWKILNEIKEIEGYLCMKAETRDTIKSQTIHAWFTDRIPFYGGPEGYSGLPGLILELDINNGDAIITATKVDLESAEFDFPKQSKKKGKKTTYAEMNKLYAKFIRESIEGEKNPYWRIRY